MWWLHEQEHCLQPFFLAEHAHILQARSMAGPCGAGVCCWTTGPQLPPSRKLGRGRGCACRSGTSGTGWWITQSRELFGSSQTGPGIGALSVLCLHYLRAFFIPACMLVLSKPRMKASTEAHAKVRSGSRTMRLACSKRTSVDWGTCMHAFSDERACGSSCQGMIARSTFMCRLIAPAEDYMRAFGPALKMAQLAWRCANVMFAAPLISFQKALPRVRPDSATCHACLVPEQPNQFPQHRLRPALMQGLTQESQASARQKGNYGQSLHP